jgi:KDO2-lipid IV(A) lauroyltransferase
VIIVTPHLGPYELGAAWAATVGSAVYGMVEELDPETMAALRRYREATGMRVIPMKQGIRAVYRALEEKGWVCLVADRVIGDTKGVLEVPFGTGRRPIPTGPATFAIGTGAPIICAWITLNPGRHPRYVVRFDPPVLASGRGDDERQRLTRHIAGRFSDMVCRNPDQWFVFQPQWVPRETA